MYKYTEDLFTTVKQVLRNEGFDAAVEYVYNKSLLTRENSHKLVEFFKEKEVG